MKVLVATEKPFAAVAVEGIRQVVETAGYELKLLEKYTDKADLLAVVSDVDGLIIRSDKVDAEVLDAAKNLKVVVRAGAGYDNIDANGNNYMTPSFWISMFSFATTIAVLLTK